eukprot:COSAG04_NODE_1552_length_6377_cov_253.592959_5_plen_1239_part_01
MFPFTYNGVTYTSCTSEAHNQLWCSTDSQYAGSWGNCVDCVPDPVTLSSNIGLVQFTSDGSVTRDGFVASFTCVAGAPPPPPNACTTGLEVEDPDNAVFNVPEGAGNYENGANCRVTATCTAAGQAPQVTFTSFNTEGGWDFVNIYDGATTDDTRLVHTSGTTAPDPTTATQGTLLLQLTTDGSVVRPGFEATISCAGAAAPPPAPPPPADCTNDDSTVLMLVPFVVGDIGTGTDSDGVSDQYGGAGATLDGSAVVDGCGLSVSGEDGARARIPNFDYAADAGFTLGYWFQKEGCTTGPWEYIYSHALLEPNILDRNNPNINVYLGCSDGGGGSFQRTIMIDNEQNLITFDYALHAAGNFDAITAVWIHMAQAMRGMSLDIFVDGGQGDGTPGAVPAAVFTTFTADQIAVTGGASMAGFTNPYMGATMATDIFIGSRMDGNAARHYMGRIAGITIGSEPICAALAQGLFAQQEAVVGGCVLGCSVTETGQGDGAADGTTLALVPFATGSGGAEDVVGGNAVTLAGDAAVDECGLHVDGASGNRATIANFDYASDGEFAFSYWFQKTECTSGPWEYIYSHATDTSSILAPANSNINSYLGCNAGAGTFQRTIAIDSAQLLATYDYYLHSAGAFDAITAQWIHIVQVFGEGKIAFYADGQTTQDDDFSTFAGAAYGGMTNAVGASATLSTAAMGGFTLNTDIFIGSRMDGNNDRHFAGAIAGLYIFGNPVCGNSVTAIFQNNENSLFQANCIAAAPPQDTDSGYDAAEDTYEWVDISSSGTAIALGDWSGNSDDGYYDVTMSFVFPFYEYQETLISIGTNGYVTFGAAHYAWGNNNPIPSPAGAVDGLVAPFWVDLNPSACGDIYYQDRGTDFVVQYQDVCYYTGIGNLDNKNTFELIVRPDGSMTFQWQSLMPDTTGQGHTANPSIGVESGDGSRGLRIAFGWAGAGVDNPVPGGDWAGGAGTPAAWTLTPTPPDPCVNTVTVYGSEGATTAIADTSGADNYGNGWTCTWLLSCTQEPGQPSSPQVTFSEFAFEAGWDYLNFYDGEDASGTGLASLHGMSVPGPVYGTRPQMFVEMTTDGSVVRQGFAGTFTCGAPGGGENPPNPCAEGQDLTWTAGDDPIDVSLSGGYSNGHDCNWVLTCADDSLAPQVTFSSFNTEGGWDFVNFYAGDNAGAPRLANLNGNLGSDAPTLVGTTPTALLQFTSDGSVTRDGFVSTFDCTAPTEPPPQDPCTTGITLSNP